MRQGASYASLSQSERIKQVNEPALCNVHWQVLGTAGTSNSLFRARSKLGPVVLRLNASGNRSFGVDRQREAAVLSRLQGLSWAPHILRNAPDQGWMLMTDYGDARPTATGDHWLALLPQWHQITDIPTFDYPALIASYAADLPDSPEATSLIQALTHTLAALPDQDHCLVHHDLHPGNLVDGGNHWRVIDWEYAGRGCPWLDLAALQRHWGLETRRIAAMPIAVGYTLDQLEDLLAQAHQMNALLEKAWWWVRNTD